MKWTTKEEMILKDVYPAKGIKGVIKELAFYGFTRNKSQVKNKVVKLGLRYFGSNNYFKKGLTPWNKGLKMPESIVEKTKATRFKKGNLPHNTKCDNTISFRSDSGTGKVYKYIRISLGKWIPLHQKMWIDANGEIPKGYVVVFKDKDTMNCNLSNLELISRAELLMRNNKTTDKKERNRKAVMSRKKYSTVDWFLRGNV